MHHIVKQILTAIAQTDHPDPDAIVCAQNFRVGKGRGDCRAERGPLKKIAPGVVCHKLLSLEEINQKADATI
jgi:hypothetical protein